MYGWLVVKLHKMLGLGLIKMIQLSENVITLR